MTKDEALKRDPTLAILYKGTTIGRLDSSGKLILIFGNTQESNDPESSQEIQQAQYR